MWRKRCSHCEKWCDNGGARSITCIFHAFCC
ncbi:hypothetical protein Nmel_008940 [Mimus melanotis]